MIKNIAIVLVALIVIILSIYGYYGGFRKIIVTTETHTSFYGASIKHTGDYREIGGAMTALDTKMRLQNIEATKGFGIYFDNPKTTAAENLRAIAGSIIHETDIEKVMELGDGVELIEVPQIKGYTARFPYKGFMSFIVAVTKVYPALSLSCEADSFKIETPSFEIYDLKNGEIIFIVPTNLSSERANSWWNRAKKATQNKLEEQTDSTKTDSTELTEPDESIETIDLQTLVDLTLVDLNK